MSSKNSVYYNQMYICVEYLWTINGHEFEQAWGNGEGQGSLSVGLQRVGWDATEQLNSGLLAA